MIYSNIESSNDDESYCKNDESDYEIMLTVRSLSFKMFNNIVNDDHEERVSIINGGHISSEFEMCFYDVKLNKLMTINIPDDKLRGTSFLKIYNEEQLKYIPTKAGNYWIVTNEPINHCFNSSTSVPTNDDFGHMVVYNGVSSNLRSRMKEHLLREEKLSIPGTQSGISVDILTTHTQGSHVKYLLSEEQTKKVPKIIVNNKKTKIISKQDILSNIYLTEDEEEFIKSNSNVLYRNGINITEKKHTRFNWYFFYTENENHSIRDYIETKWRERYGVPHLCSYSVGR